MSIPKISLGDRLRIVVGVTADGRPTMDGRVEPGDAAYVDEVVVVKGFAENIEAGWFRIEVERTMEAPPRDDFGPPPAIIQLVGLLEDLARTAVGSGALQDKQAYQLGLAHGLAERLIEIHPALTTGADGRRYER